jgi:hypothetical protein
MNWLGWSWVAFFGALLGAAVGVLAFAVAANHGVDAPYAIGISIGLGAASTSPDRSGLRGIIFATFAVWVAAIAQNYVGPFAGRGVLSLHETLTPPRLLAFVACAVAAWLLASTSFRPSARKRIAGA